MASHHSRMPMLFSDQFSRRAAREGFNGFRAVAYGVIVLLTASVLLTGLWPVSTAYAGPFDQFSAPAPTPGQTGRQLLDREPGEILGDTRDNRIASARRYVEAFPIKKVCEDSLQALDESMQGQLPATQRSKIESAMLDPDRLQRLEDKLVSTLARHFTLGEINAMADFYSSPHGSSIVNKLGPYMADFNKYMLQEMELVFRETGY